MPLVSARAGTLFGASDKFIVEQLNVSYAGVTSLDVALSRTYDLTSTFLLVSHTQTDFARSSTITARFLNASTVRLESATTDTLATVTLYIVSIPGCVVQEVTGTITGTSLTSTISAVDLSRTFVTGNFRADGGGFGQANQLFTVFDLPTSTSVSAARLSSADNAFFVAYVVQLPVGCSVERVPFTIFTFDGGAKNVTISSVNLATSFIAVTAHANSANIDDNMVRAQFNSATQIRLQSGSSSVNRPGVAFIVDLAGVVPATVTALSSGSFTGSSFTHSLTSVPSSNAFVIGSAWTTANQYPSTRLRYRISDDKTDLVIERTGTSNAVNENCFVVNLG